MRELFAKNKKSAAIDTTVDVIGCFIFSMGVQSFSAPLNLPPGGVTGYAVILNYLLDIPISVISFVINMPLLVLAYFFLGKKTTLNTVKTVIILAITLEIAHRIIPVYQGDIMLAAIFGGVLQGIGLGFVFLRGSTTGGTDIIAKLIQRKFPHLAMGRILFALDCISIILTAIVYSSLSNALYAMILVFVSSRLIDTLVYGVDTGRMLMIISEQYDEIAEAVHQELDRGSTLLKGVGTYTGINRPVLLCAISTPEFQRLKRLVYEKDPKAFVVSVQTDEVFGEGFTPFSDRK